MSGGARRPPVYTKVHISCTGNVYRHDFVLYRCLRPSPVVVPVSLGPCAGTGRWGVPVAGGGVGDRGLAARRWCRLCCNGCCSQGVVASNRRACVATSWGRRRWTCSRTCSRGPRTTTRSPEVAWYDENDVSQSLAEHHHRSRGRLLLRLHDRRGRRRRCDGDATATRACSRRRHGRVERRLPIIHGAHHCDAG